MSQMMSIDTDNVSAAVNRISTLLSDIDTRTNKFIELVKRTNEESHGNFQLIVTLEERLCEEAKNVNDIVVAQDEIKESLRKYTELSEDADDDTELR